MMVSSLIEYLNALMEEHGDLNVTFCDYECHEETGKERTLGVSSAFAYDGTIYISDAPWWETP